MVLFTATFKGLASRMCLEGGIWGKVDVTNCASKLFADIQSQVCTLYTRREL